MVAKQIVLKKDSPFKKRTQKTVSELLLLTTSYQEAQEVKKQLVRRQYTAAKAERLGKEIDFYCMVLYKEQQYNLYREWIRLADLDETASAIGFIYDPMTEKFYSEIQYATFKLLKYIINEAGGVEEFYNYQASAVIKQLKKSEFDIY